MTTISISEEAIGKVIHKIDSFVWVDEERESLETHCKGTTITNTEEKMSTGKN